MNGPRGGTAQRLLGYVTTRCGECRDYDPRGRRFIAAYQKHGLWKEAGRTGRYVLACQECGTERGLETNDEQEEEQCGKGKHWSD